MLCQSTITRIGWEGYRAAQQGYTRSRILPRSVQRVYYAEAIILGAGDPKTCRLLIWWRWKGWQKLTSPFSLQLWAAEGTNVRLRPAFPSSRASLKDSFTTPLRLRQPLFSPLDPSTDSRKHVCNQRARAREE